MSDAAADTPVTGPPAYVDLSHVKDGNALLGLQQALPDALAAEAGQLMDEGEEVLFSFPVDMNLLGQYAQEWLVLTERRCAAWTEHEDGYERRVAFRLDDLREVRLRELTGNHILLVDRGSGWEELARSSNLTAWKLKPTRQVLTKVAEDGAAALEKVRELDLKLPQRHVCPTCGRIIRPRVGTCLACMNKRRVLLRLLKLLLPYWLMVVAAFVLLLLAGSRQLIGPLIQRCLIDLVFVPAVGGAAPAESFWFRFAPAGSGRLLLVFAAFSGALILIPAALGGVRQYVISWVGHRTVMDLSNGLFAHMMRLSLSFYHREETGRAMARLTRDMRRIQQFISGRLQMVLADAIFIIGIIVIMLVMHWRLALLALLPIPILVGVSELARRKLHRVYHVLWRRYAAMSHFLAGIIPGIRVVKAFAQGPREVVRFGGIMGRLFSFEMRATKVRAVLEPVLTVSTGLGGLIVMVGGGLMVIRGGGAEGALRLGALTAFTYYMLGLYRPALDLVRILPEFEQAATSADRVFEVLDSEPELEGPERTVEMPTIEGRVEFRNVTFGYEPDEPVLKDISFVVEPGEMIGLVGHSGAGKTTLINLVCHFYKTDEGHVLIDGLDLTDVKVKSVRRQIGIVSQEPFLFSGTIGENIAYSSPGATEKEVVAAATAANAHEFILDFPEGYDSLVGERGIRVSGGERQRIAIARAILKDPRILILDEATSSVDTETEERIQEALRRLIAGRTTFAIAHRLSTLKFADRLLVLERGRLVEGGTHDELMTLGGVYANLCRKQTELSRITAWRE